MPIITLTAGPMTKEQKAALIKGLTEVSMAVTGAPEQAHAVAIHELPLDGLGLGKESVEYRINNIKL